MRCPLGYPSNSSGRKNHPDDLFAELEDLDKILTIQMILYIPLAIRPYALIIYFFLDSIIIEGSAYNDTVVNGKTR